MSSKELAAAARPPAAAQPPARPRSDANPVRANLVLQTPGIRKGDSSGMGERLTGKKAAGITSASPGHKGQIKWGECARGSAAAAADNQRTKRKNTYTAFVMGVHDQSVFKRTQRLLALLLLLLLLLLRLFRPLFRRRCSN